MKKQRKFALSMCSLLLGTFLFNNLVFAENEKNAKNTIQIETISEEDLKKSITKEEKTKKESIETVNNKYKCNKWAAKSVMEADKHGIIPSNSDNLKNLLDRETTAKILFNFYSLYNHDLPDTFITFKDTEDKDVIYSTSLGLIPGTHKNLFSPKKEVKRGEAFYLLDNIMDKIGIDLPVILEDIKFNDDEDILDEHYNAIQKLYKLGLINTDNENNINPNGYMEEQDFINLVIKVKDLNIEMGITNIMQKSVE